MLMYELERKYSNKFGNISIGSLVDSRVELGEDERREIEVLELGWGSLLSQEDRFRVLLEIPGIDVELDSVLDVGCGYGDLSRYLNSGLYRGIDVRLSAIERACCKYEGLDFVVSDIYGEDIDVRYDWVFGSGIFCFDGLFWEFEVLGILFEMFKRCRRGVGVNFLSDLSDGVRDKDMRYCRPEDISRLVSLVTKKFVLRHDYRKNDMTVYLLK